MEPSHHRIWNSMAAEQKSRREQSARTAFNRKSKNYPIQGRRTEKFKMTLFFRRDFHVEVYDGRRMGERARGNEVDSGLGDLTNRFQRDPA